MTIGIGLVYKDGVLLCSDSQFTMASSKMDGQLGYIEASWGRVYAAVAGNPDYGAAAFQQLERTKEDTAAKRAPLRYIENKLKAFYKEHVFGHPLYDKDDEAGLSYTLLLSVGLKKGAARLFRVHDTFLREIKSFECIGSGDDAARGVLRFVHTGRYGHKQAIAVASYALEQAKVHADGCGGGSQFAVLTNPGRKEVASIELNEIAQHFTGERSCWFVQEAQRFMSGHTLGDKKAFEERLKLFVGRARHLRYLWDSRQSAQPNQKAPKQSRIDLPQWPELLEGYDES